ncbi:MAG: GFA family protein [Burkholderiales bacterium]|nr:GFA family protein [Burkholderiales bacterium]
MKTYRATCHCGAVRVEADLDLTQPTFRCNCSVCRRNRFWAAVARPDSFRVLAGDGEMTQYLWGRKKNEHWFCKHCGVRVFGIGNDTPIGRMYGVNVGCIEGLEDADFEAIPVTCVDGAHDRWESAPEHGRWL